MIYIGSDHAGYDLKEKIKQILEELKFDYIDCTPQKIDSDDYPDVARVVSEKIVQGTAEDRGILVCGTGIGMSIAANKVRGVRAALVCGQKEAELSRKHNDANVLCLSGWKQSFVDKNLLTTWLTSDFEAGRHKRRIIKITGIESGWVEDK